MSHALRYVARGWAVIPVSAGQAVPIEKDWPGRPRRTRDELAAMVATYPDANIGIVTGAASDIWVLDIDPRHGGDVALAGLVRAYGALPETYATSTPHGGTHYYFSMPKDFEPTNRTGTGTNGIPRGVDIRGRNGQVVAPPSVRDGVAYAVLLDVAVVEAPEWLVELIRPSERPADPAPAREWPAEPPGASTQTRGAAYAQRALHDLWSELALALPGSRNQTAFRVACRMIELSNASWAAIDKQSALGSFMLAAAGANADGTFSDREAYACWLSAEKHIGERAAELPPIDIYGSVVAPPINFTGPGMAYATAMVVPGPAQEAPLAVDPVEVAIGSEVSRLWIREQAKRRLREILEPSAGIEILDEDAIDQIRLPDPLIEGWLYRGHVVRVFGPPGAAKTFLAVDWAASIATGTAWHGRKVERGEVLYVAAEDPAGVGLRLRAWRTQAGIERHGVRLVREPMNLDEAGAARLIAAIQRGGFTSLRLVVLDTQAMVTVGLDEDGAREMGLFAKGIKQLARETGAAVLIVHHSGVAGGRGRGSTAMDGAMDAEYETSLAGATMTLKHKKAKNTERQDPIIFGLHRVTLPGELDSFGRAVTSCVLVAAGDVGTAGHQLVAGGIRIVSPAPLRRPEREELAAVLISVLKDVFSLGVGGTKAEIRREFLFRIKEAGTSQSRAYAKFDRAWGFLTDIGRIGRNPVRDTFKFVALEGESDDLTPNAGKLDDHGYVILTSS